MTQMRLSKTRMTAGIWEGVLKGVTEAPVLTLRNAGKLVPGLELTPDPAGAGFVVRAPIPASLISDGIQTFVIADEATGEALAQFAVLAGEALDDDIRAELDLLRAELDMLKRAFRRHCVETL